MISNRSFRSLIASIALSLCHIVSDTVSYCLAKFEPTVDAAVEKICAIGRSMKTVFIAKAIGSGSGDSTACNGFVSLRRSLDASELA